MVKKIYTNKLLAILVLGATVGLVTLGLARHIVSFDYLLSTIGFLVLLASAVHASISRQSNSALYISTQVVVLIFALAIFALAGSIYLSGTAQDPLAYIFVDLLLLIATPVLALVVSVITIIEYARNK